MTLGEKIKKLRLEKDMTLEELGNKTKLSKQTIFKYEDGTIKNIPSDKIETIAKVLDVTPAYLMGWGEDSESPNTSTINKESLLEIMEIVKSIKKDIEKIPLPRGKKQNPLITIANQHEDYNFSENQLRQIDNFINFVKEQEKKEPPQ